MVSFRSFWVMKVKSAVLKLNVVTETFAFKMTMLSTADYLVTT